MNHAMCAGVFYRWSANDDANSSTFLFYNETLALPAHTGASIVAHGPGGDSPFPVFGAGDWALLQAAAPVPEPSGVAMLAVGLIGVGWAGRRRLRSVQAQATALRPSRRSPTTNWISAVAADISTIMTVQ